MTDLEKLIKDKIKSLETIIEFRNTNEESQNTYEDNDRGISDSNEYFWSHNGGHDFYKGKLQMLKELIGDKK